MKLENDPNLKEQAKILDHHPHKMMAPHGTIRKAKPHLLAMVHNPRKKRD